MTTTSEPRICLIGAGRLGRTIIRSYGSRIAVIITRNLSSVYSEFPEAGERFVVHTDLATLDQAMFDLIWLAVPDHEIGPMGERLIRELSFSNHLIIHSAGAHGRRIVADRVSTATRVAAIHPNAILDGSRPFDAGIVWGVTAEADDRPVIDRLIDAVGGIALDIAEESRPLYHAAATFTANYVKTLAHAAMTIYEEIGVDRSNALTMIRSYLHSATTSFDVNSLSEHLTGPAARGDLSTLHLQRQRIVDRLPHLLKLFDTLVDATLREVRPELREEWARGRDA